MMSIHDSKNMLKMAGIHDSDPERMINISLLESYGLDAYSMKKRALRNAFSKMNNLPANSILRQWLENLTRKSMQYGQQIKNETYIRRHNTFVQYYILQLGKRAIQQNQFITGRTIHKDINYILDKMMVFAYGIDALNPKG